MILGQTRILIQADGLDLGEVQLAGFILCNQFLVGANRTGTGSQTQNAIGLQVDLCGFSVSSLLYRANWAEGGETTSCRLVLTKTFALTVGAKLMASI